MKMNNKLTVKLVAIALLTVMIVTFTHCGKTAKEIGGSIPETAHYTTPAADPLQELQVTTGIKNHEEILYTMGVVTGIPPHSVSSIINVYRQVEHSLPTDNNIKIFTASQQIAVTKLAAEFCFFLGDGGFNIQRGKVWPGFNISLLPDVAFSQINKEIFIENTISNLWGGMVSDEERTLAFHELESLIDESINGEITPIATQRAFRAACTAALSSAYVTFL